MRFSRSEPGFLVSAAVHLGLLAFLLVHFSHDEQFADATEAIPVETVTDAQFHEIMQGEKTAKLAEKPQADKVAEPSELKPTPPPPPPRPEPSQADRTPPPPTPPAPPPRPAPPPPEAKAPPPEPEKQVERDDAETVRPPPRPKKPEQAQQKPAPEPPKRPRKSAPKLDEVAKLLAEAKDKPAPKPKASAPREKPHQAANLDEVAKLLDEKAPEAKFTTGREVSHAAALGARHAAGARMSPSMADSLGALLQEQYKQCWNYLPLTADKYVAKIRVSFRPDGSLASQPVLLNPPSDPAFRGLAESAMRAVRRCNPLRIPAQYQPYYDQWKDWVVGFDPEILN